MLYNTSMTAVIYQYCVYSELLQVVHSYSTFTFIRIENCFNLLLSNATSKKMTYSSTRIRRDLTLLTRALHCDRNGCICDLLKCQCDRNFKWVANVSLIICVPTLGFGQYAIIYYEHLFKQYCVL